MTEEKKPKLKSIILVYEDGSTIELTEEDLFNMSKNHILLFGASAFSWGLMASMGNHARKLKKQKKVKL